jgi:4-amino-4-deoxy-L-arabinose transferase-like glycosyltransferase
MVFYAPETQNAVTLAFVPLLMSLFAFFVYKKEGLSLFFLLLSAFALRMVMISLDPYLHEWDERYHALVAKNMIDYPFKPMLRVNPLMPYEIEGWCCNHIWVHKQPLFLWQMALSMKIFGVNEIALRLPSAIMGTIAVYLTFDIAKIWTKNSSIAFIAAALVCSSNYHLELISGRISLDHNDFGFTFYVTAAIWAFSRYTISDQKIKWAILTGIFMGASILIKWLTGFVVIGGWGLYILTNRTLNKNFKSYLHAALAFISACIVFLPWQLYIMKYFPKESAVTYALNKKHIFEALDGHAGPASSHLEFLYLSYSIWLLAFIPIGMIGIFFRKKISLSLTLAFLSMVLVVFLFFSLIVKTKMPAFPYPINAIVWIWIACGIFCIFELISLIPIKIHPYVSSSIFALTITIFAFLNLRLSGICSVSSNYNEARNAKIHNTKIYKSLTIPENDKRIVLNCKSYEDVELMFYKDLNVYPWCIDSVKVDSFLKEGYKISVFNNHNNQNIPNYLSLNKKVEVLQLPFR